MKDVNLLSDIEKDINGDWKSIQIQIKKEKENKKIEHLLKNKNRWNMPGIDQFLESLKKITYEGNREANLIELQVLVHRILMQNEHGEILPKSFENIWRMFCDPYKYSCSTITCGECRRTYNIFYEREPELIENHRWGLESRSIEFNRNVFHCVHCGSRFVFYGDKILGVFEE